MCAATIGVAVPEDTGVSIWVVIAVAVAALVLLSVPAYFVVDWAIAEGPDVIAELTESDPEPVDVRFDVETLFSGQGVFVASGTAVESGLVCREGVTRDIFIQERDGPGFSARMTKEFICIQSTQSFLIDLDVRTTQEGVVFDWSVTTGDESGLSGGGDGFVVREIPGGVLDRYRVMIQR